MREERERSPRLDSIRPKVVDRLNAPPVVGAKVKHEECAWCTGQRRNCVQRRMHIAKQIGNQAQKADMQEARS